MVLDKIIPPKLVIGDEIRVVSPARSLATPWIQAVKSNAINNLEKLSLKVTFSKNSTEIDDFESSSIQSRVEDLHEAFSDKNVKMIISTIGGFSSNQLLSYLDYDLIKENPKILCGYSDITALSSAIYTKTGVVTYSGPHFFSFGQTGKNLKHTIEYFKKCFFSNESFEVIPSESWIDGWANDIEGEEYIENEGYWAINEGEAKGKIVGGNQCTLNLLQGTEFMPDIRSSILFLEDDYEAHVSTVDRDLQSLIHQSGFEEVRGIVFGRFQPTSGVTRSLLTQIIKTKKELDSITVIANSDFGHTLPIISFPIGGTAKIDAISNQVRLDIIEH